MQTSSDVRKSRARSLTAGRMDREEDNLLLASQLLRKENLLRCIKRQVLRPLWIEIYVEHSIELFSICIIQRKC
jgi:hypothetical protein